MLKTKVIPLEFMVIEIVELMKEGKNE